MKLHYSILTLLLVLLTCPAAIAQGEANIWYFGNKAGLDFSGGNPVAVFDGQLNAVEGCTTISDAQGNLQFYTNGITVWNKYHIPMANGTGLFGDFSSTQAAVVVQKPGAAGIYYIFTTNPFEIDGGLRYSTVDMSANNGLGQVTSKNNLLNSSICEKTAVVRHANGQDVWVVTHLWNSDAFYAVLVTSSGISPVQVTSHSGTVVTADTDFANAIGSLKVSPDGKKIVACHTFMNKAELFDFDPSTGHISNPRILIDDANVYGAEFSPDNQTLYISAVEQKKLFQFDLRAEDIAASKFTLATLPQSPGALQLAPNGKIYIAMAETDKLSVIEHPDKLGTPCNLQVNAVDLGGRMCMLGLPAYNQTFFYTKLSAENLCAGGETGFSFEAGFVPSGLSWNFGDGSPVSILAGPTHQFTAGTHTVTVTASFPGGTITRTKELSIAPSPTVAPLGEQTFCINSPQAYSLSSNTANLLDSQPAEEFAVSYFATLADAQNNTDPLPDNFTITAGSTTIFVAIKSLQSAGCSAITQFTLTGYQSPVDVANAEISSCDGIVRDDRAEFDLDATAGQILENQPAGCLVKFYRSEADAENNHDPIFGTYTNEIDGQTIYVVVQGAGGCHKIAPLRLVVKKCDNAEDFDIFPKFFTPNGDGYNDHWQTKASIGAPSFKIEIFDRFGRLLKTITPIDLQWDGSFAGQNLPSDDYWFVLSGENIREYRGHFSLKR